MVLKTRQVDHLRRFYGSLGIRLNEEQHGKGPVDFVGQVSGVVLKVYPLHEGESPADTTTRLGFTVEKLGEVVRTLQSIEVLVVTKPQMTRRRVGAVVRGRDGSAAGPHQR